MGAATSAAMDSLNGGVTIIWHNQQQIEAEARQVSVEPILGFAPICHAPVFPLINPAPLPQCDDQLLQNAHALAKQTEQWCNTFASFDHSLKALGDVENWVASLAVETRFVAASFEMSSGGASGRSVDIAGAPRAPLTEPAELTRVNQT